MKAIVFERYGSPDVLQLKEVEKPVPNADEVLIKIHAASANPLDWHRMRGAPFVARLSGGLRKPSDPRLGVDIAGQVEAVGSNAKQFQPGDEVFGAIANGGFAEYASTAEKTLALKPANSSFEQAAAVPVAAFTALQGLRDKGRIKSGQKVLVNGASGGVGTFAVQIAKSFGAEVTGVCSTRNLDMVRSIGADQVIDYTQKDFTNNGQLYDLIYDAVGNRSTADYKRALTPEGVCVIAGFSGLGRLFEHMVLAPRMSGNRVGLMGLAKPNQKDLVFLKELIETGKVVPVIDRRYPLSKTAEAIGYLEQGHAQGKVIITVASATPIRT
jgi:NADPH:quinone reductase-like Zn-dependent oxidoreductase